ncbi:MAG: pyridoxamine 5'-phosphate oxidase family protein [Acetatifactor sp.]|nr:pyridoxamine 5'-phosphate oxidase family protein [Acetatifactor sp.]
MFREMRRNKQLLEEKESIEIMEKGTAGVLALSGDEGYPYALPISYVYSNSKLYFHSAVSGHKIDAIRNSNKASFCVISQDCIVPEEYISYYKSVIAFGKIRILEEESEKKTAIELLARKYHPSDTQEGRTNTIREAWPRLCLLELEIEHLTGKAARELMN